MAKIYVISSRNDQQKIPRPMVVGTPDHFQYILRCIAVDLVHHQNIDTDLPVLVNDDGTEFFVHSLPEI